MGPCVESMFRSKSGIRGPYLRSDMGCLCCVSMHYHVLLHIPSTSEEFPAHGAGISAQFEVHFPDMLVEPTGLGKRPITFGTHIPLQHKKGTM